MSDAPEDLLEQIRSLEERLAGDVGDVLSRVRLGQLKKRYRLETGTAPPTTEASRNFGHIHLGDINISGTGHAIAPGGTAIGRIENASPAPSDSPAPSADEELMSRMLADALARSGGDADLVRRVNKLEDAFTDSTALETSARAFSGERDARSGAAHTPYPSHVCRLDCLDADGSPVSSGTGFLIASRLVLTCQHVVSRARSVRFRFASELRDGLPEFNGKVRYSHTLTATARQWDGRLHLWADSPPFETIDDFLAGRRDVALLEIDPGSELMGVFIEADRNLINRIAVHSVMAAISVPSDPLGPCASAAINPTQPLNIELLRPVGTGGVTRSPGSTNSANGLAWHTIDDTERGDSGAPLMVKDCGIAGMHTSRGDVGGGVSAGRFVHVEQIRDLLDGNDGLKNSSHAEALRNYGWIS